MIIAIYSGVALFKQIRIWTKQSMFKVVQFLNLTLVVQERKHYYSLLSEFVVKNFPLIDNQTVSDSSFISFFKEEFTF